MRPIEELLKVMEDHTLIRLVCVDGPFRVELERHPSAFLPPPSTEPMVPDRSDLCACGHGLKTEHSETGCFHGCSVDLCNETKVGAP